MKTTKFFVENPSFIVYVDSSINPDFINNGFFAEDIIHAYKIARSLIEYNFGINHALNSDWYVSDGQNEIHCIDLSCANMD